MNSRRISAYLLFLIVTLISAVAGVVIKFTLGGISTLPFLTYRFAISAAVAIVVTLANKRFPRDTRTLVELFIFSFLTSTVALGLLFLGLEKTTVLDMSIITAIGPLVIALAGVFFLKEHVTNREKFGMAIAFLGTLTVLAEPIIRLHDGKLETQGNLLILIYVFVTAVSAVLGKKLLRKGVEPIVMVNAIFIVGFATIAPVSLYIYGFGNLKNIVTDLSLPFHAGVVFMALISGNLAYFIGNRAQKTIEIGEAALFSYLIPIFTAPLAIIFLREEITPIFAIGSAIVLAGVVIAEYKRSLSKFGRKKAA